MNSWFSRMSVDAGHGSLFYAREDGTEVEVTTVDTDASLYLWPDKEPRGEVVRFVRLGSPRQCRTLLQTNYSLARRIVTSPNGVEYVFVEAFTPESPPRMALVSMTAVAGEPLHVGNSIDLTESRH